jgi:hypothetical protein
MQSPLIYSHYHAAAISLSNTGVSLAERGCFRQSVEVFKQSVDFMKMVSSMTTSAQQGDDSKKRELEKRAVAFWPTAQGILRKASHTLFHQEPDVDVAILSSLAPIDLKVVTLEASEVTALQILKRNEEVSSSAGKLTFLLRIESCIEGSTSSSNFHVFDVNSSIILFNFATAFECLAVVSRSSEECRTSALSLSILSYSIFHDNFWVLEPAQDNGVWADYLPLLIIFLQNLEELSSTSGKESDAQVFYLKLVEVSEVFVKRQLHLAEVFGGQATAAAA